MASTQRIKLFALAFALLLLLVQTLLAEESGESDEKRFNCEGSILFRAKRFIFHSIVGILSTASRASAIQILLDVMPAKGAYLELKRKKLSRCGVYLLASTVTHLITTGAWLEI